MTSRPDGPMTIGRIQPSFIGTWTAIDTDSKPLPFFYDDKRDAEEAADEFISDLADRLVERVQLTDQLRGLEDWKMQQA
jgi:hypothetical protein